jgi:hypothetical protein
MMQLYMCHPVLGAALLVLYLALLHSIPRVAVHMEHLPERDWDWGLHNSYLRTHPPLVEQHRRGARLFEIDAYWWLGGNWIVAHVPVVGAGSHVKTVADAVCTLRQLGDSTTMMLDIKNVAWPSCGSSAVQELRRALGACAQDGPLRVLVDVYCGDYNNIQCARSLRGTSIANTTLLYRGIDYWWMGVGGDGRLKQPCGEFAEPDLDTANFSKPVYMECIAARAACEQAARVHGVTWLQAPCAQFAHGEAL